MMPPARERVRKSVAEKIFCDAFFVSCIVFLSHFLFHDHRNRAVIVE